MPVGTQGAVKTLGSDDLEGLGFELILANTYHLGLRPGADAVERLGGLHRFMSWDRAILTDSGGYQVMSLAKRRKITDEGVAFQSHLDGAELFLSPEKAVQIQSKLGVDVMMALDVCPEFGCSKDEAAEAMRLTHAWAERCLAEHSRPPPSGFPESEDASAESAVSPALFGIFQGGTHEDLRRESAAFVTSLPFDGFAIGGVSVGEPEELMRPIVELAAPLLPDGKPRYLMGVGHPQDILHAVSCGVDLFDCVLPTRLARHHSLYTLKGRINILNAQWAEADGPIDPESVFPQTQRYSAAYLHHLFKAEEPLGPRLATIHNLAFYARLMAEIREAIGTGGWPGLASRYQDC